jgi:UDP-N-acetylmuramate dehydrogenase
MEIRKNVSLKPHNTFGIDVRARRFTLLSTDQDIITFLNSHQKDQKSLLFLGGGSNILFTKDYEGTVAKIATKGIFKVRENVDHVWIRAAAGEEWDSLVKYCVERGWGGLENLSLIPGTVGAAPVQNIGAYGTELKDSLFMIDVFDRKTFCSIPLRPEQCHFGYRDSIFKQSSGKQYVILSVTFRLSRKPTLKLDYGSIREELSFMSIHKPSITHMREAIIRIRRRKLPDPALVGNAGSFFRNPEVRKDIFEVLQKQHPSISYFPAGDSIRIPAAWLIEQCGWKGFRQGYAGVHPDHPLVLVNYGTASGKEILELVEKIRKSVFDRFGIFLVEEVNIV